MDGLPTWTDCDEAGDYVVPNVLSPRDLVSRPDIMDETVLVTHTIRQQRQIRLADLCLCWTYKSVSWGGGGGGHFSYSI